MEFQLLLNGCSHNYDDEAWILCFRCFRYNTDSDYHYKEYKRNTSQQKSLSI
jgi:hypothetical protein